MAGIVQRLISPELRAKVREPIWSAAAVAAQPTARWRVEPDYLVIGAQRAGTTSLQAALSAHPNIASARWMKGVHYFDTGYHHPTSWYQGHFPTRLQARRVATATGAPLRCGEASPYYLFHPLAAARIAQDLPAARLIVMLRDPVERTISHHKHETRRGNESLPLAEALAAEAQRLAGESERIVAEAPNYRSVAHQTFSYVARSEYGPQIERLFALVARPQVLVVQSERFFAAPREVWSTVLRFLEVPYWEPPAFPRENATPDSSVDPAVKEGLRAHFAASNEQVFELIGERFGWQ